MIVEYIAIVFSGESNMSDKDTALPIRSQADGLDERVHVKIVDGTNPSVNQTTVDSDKNLHVEIHGDDPAASDKVVRLSELGAITPDGVYDVTNNTKPGNSGLIAHQRSATPGDATQTERITSVTYATDNVKALDVALHDENGAPFSISNPLPTVVVETEGGVEVQDHQASALPLAVNGVENHDYTVTVGKTLKMFQILASASGKIKVEVSVDIGAGLVVKATYFNSTATPNVDTTFKIPFSVAATKQVRIAITNRDNQPMDVYSTVIGVES